ncbi:MAG: hypothetical protein HYY88_06155 [candidate division NC10 bacterium]|nr:hypothetical protein [candidate division NC10 bacterium]
MSVPRAGRGARSILLVVAVAGVLAACGQEPGRIASEPRRPSVPDRVPIVFLPGVGREVARVLRGGGLVPFSALSLRTDAEAIAHLGDPRFPADGTPAADVPARLDGALRETDVRGLQGLIDHLVREGGYVRGDPNQPRDKDYPENAEADRRDTTRVASLYVLYYDWRRDMSENACVVAERIARIREATGAPRVHLVTHSFGGLVARYYLRYGGRDTMRNRDCPLGDRALAAAVNAPGAPGVGRLVLLGVPHRGSALAFRALLQDVSLFGLLALGLREAVFTMPLAWQLLPQPEADGRVPLLVGNNGDERVSLYALRTWVERGWLPGDGQDPERLRFAEAMLARAVAVQKAMAGRHPAEEAVPRLVVGAECRPTPTRAIVTETGVEFLARGQTDHPLFARATDAGDGVVTAENALGLPDSPTLTSLATCAGHNTYLDDPSLVARIVEFLLR